MNMADVNGHLGNKWVTLLVIPALTVVATASATITLIGERQSNAATERARIEEQFGTKLHEHETAENLRFAQIQADLDKHTARPAHEGARDRITHLEADEAWIISKLKEIDTRCKRLEK